MRCIATPQALHNILTALIDNDYQVEFGDGGLVLHAAADPGRGSEVTPDPVTILPGDNCLIVDYPPAAEPFLSDVLAFAEMI